MARMLGASSTKWCAWGHCSTCAPAHPQRKERRQARAIEKRKWRREARVGV